MCEQQGGLWYSEAISAVSELSSQRWEDAVGNSGEEWPLGLVGLEWVMCGVRVPGGTGSCRQRQVLLWGEGLGHSRDFFFLSFSVFFLSGAWATSPPLAGGTLGEILAGDLTQHSAIANEVVWVLF